MYMYVYICLGCHLRYDKHFCDLEHRATRKTSDFKSGELPLSPSTPLFCTMLPIFFNLFLFLFLFLLFYFFPPRISHFFNMSLHFFLFIVRTPNTEHRTPYCILFILFYSVGFYGPAFSASHTLSRRRPKAPNSASSLCKHTHQFTIDS